jgi:hypothetical protein
MNYELEIKDTSNVDLSEDEELNYNNISSLKDELHRLTHWANQYKSSGTDAKIEQLKKRIEKLKNLNNDTN